MDRVAALEAQLASFGAASGQLPSSKWGTRVADLEKQMVKLSAKCTALEEAQAGLEVKIADVEVSVKGMAGAA